MVKSGIERTKKYVLGSIDAYMRGDDSLTQIIGIIRSSGLAKSDLQVIFSSYRQTYASNSRFIDFDNESKRLGYI